jgi:hypothetical protein
VGPRERLGIRPGRCVGRRLRSECFRAAEATAKMVRAQGGTMISLQPCRLSRIDPGLKAPGAANRRFFTNWRHSEQHDSLRRATKWSLSRSKVIISINTMPTRLFDGVARRMHCDSTVKERRGEANGISSQQNPVVEPDGVGLPYLRRVIFWDWRSIGDVGYAACSRFMFNRPRATLVYEVSIGMMILSIISPILGTEIRFGFSAHSFAAP